MKVIWKSHVRFSAPEPSTTKRAANVVATQPSTPSRRQVRQSKCASTRWAATATKMYGKYCSPNRVKRSRYTRIGNVDQCSLWGCQMLSVGWCRPLLTRNSQSSPKNQKWRFSQSRITSPATRVTTWTTITAGVAPSQYRRGEGLSSWHSAVLKVVIRRLSRFGVTSEEDSAHETTEAVICRRHGLELYRPLISHCVDRSVDRGVDRGVDRSMDRGMDRGEHRGSPGTARRHGRVGRTRPTGRGRGSWEARHGPWTRPSRPVSFKNLLADAPPLRPVRARGRRLRAQRGAARRARRGRRGA